MKLVNPKTEEHFETELSDQEVLEGLSKLNSDFSMSLHTKYAYWSPSQRYWAYKLVNDSKPIILETNLGAFLARFPRLQFKFPTCGKVYMQGGGEVWSGRQFCGKVVCKEFFPTGKCPDIIKVQIAIFAIDPVVFLETCGKDTGRCCVCGRLLTNEGSVERGIGPICAAKYSL